MTRFRAINTVSTWRSLLNINSWLSTHCSFLFIHITALCLNTGQMRNNFLFVFFIQILIPKTLQLLYFLFISINFLVHLKQSRIDSIQKIVYLIINILLILFEILFILGFYFLDWKFIWGLWGWMIREEFFWEILFVWEIGLAFICMGTDLGLGLVDVWVVIIACLFLFLFQF